jgi:hypothetical protein
MKKKILIAVCLFIPAAFAHADFAKESWAKVRDITLPAISSAEYVRVPLDAAAASGGNAFRDIRVLSGGTEVPYQLVTEDAAVISAYAPSRTLDVVTDRAGRLMFILDLGGEGTLHSRLHVELSSKNYRRQVSVYTASALVPHDSSSWNLLTDKGYIYKFTDERAGAVAAGGDIDYPESSARYLRVVVEGGPEGALTFGSAGVYRYAVESAKEVTETVAAEVNSLPKEQATEVIADLGAAGIPTRGILLSVKSTGNFSRSATLYGGNDGKTWSYIGNGYLSRIETPKFAGSNLSIAYGESSSRYYRVLISNYDDAPLLVEPSVRVTGVLRTVVFEAQPGAPYALFYGNRDAYAPRYDLSRFFNYLDTTALREATLGAERDNTAYVPPEPPVVPFTERNKILLNVTLALLVIAIAAFVFFYIWRHVRNHDASPLGSSPQLASPSSTPAKPQPPLDTPPPPSESAQ